MNRTSSPLASLKRLVSIKFLIAISLTTSLGIFTAPAISETVAIPLGQQGDQWNITRPKTGTSKAQVINQYGEPLARSGPIGNPSIYTWSYEKFKVYFEDDYVIHSVVIAK